MTNLIGLRVAIGTIGRYLIWVVGAELERGVPGGVGELGIRYRTEEQRDDMSCLPLSGILECRPLVSVGEA